MRFLTLLLVLASGTSVAAQSKPDSDLDSQSKKFLAYAEDFAAIADDHQSDSAEWEVAISLEHTAEKTADYLVTAGNLSWIHDTVCVTDQAKITPLIKATISHYGGEIDLSIKQTNNDIAYAKAPALAITADRMKKDLQDVRERLASLQNSLKP